MITNPDLFLSEFVDAVVDSFLVHWEGNANLRLRPLVIRPDIKSGYQRLGKDHQDP